MTGLGLVTPLGAGRSAFWDALAAGRSGVRRISQFDPSGLPCQMAGEVPDFDAKQFIDRKDRKSLKMMARSIQMGVVASLQALQDATLDPAQLDPARFGLSYGASLIASELEELGPAADASVVTPGTVDLHRWGANSLAVMPPLWMLKYLPNMPACHVSIMTNAQGPSNTITENEVAGLLALAEGQRILQRGLADVMLCGASDSKVNVLSQARMQLFRQVSRRNETPASAVRPFDRSRDGTVLGEGAAVVVLEDLAHAEKRGANILAELLGCGAAFDAKRQGAGLARAIRAALKQAGVAPEELDHINAHGESTTLDDAFEAAGIMQAFEGRPPRVFAPKSYFGNLMSAGGLAELAASLLALKARQLPPTLNYSEPDPACPLPVHAGTLAATNQSAFLKVSFTDAGQCSAAVFRVWPTAA